MLGTKHGTLGALSINMNMRVNMREYEVKDLDTLGWIKISFVGEENIYFKHMNVWCFCKVG